MKWNAEQRILNIKIGCYFLVKMKNITREIRSGIGYGNGSVVLVWWWQSHWSERFTQFSFAFKAYRIMRENISLLPCAPLFVCILNYDGLCLLEMMMMLMMLMTMMWFHIHRIPHSIDFPTIYSKRTRAKFERFLVDKDLFSNSIHKYEYHE